jgi:hypothetical protein
MSPPAVAARRARSPLRSPGASGTGSSRPRGSPTHWGLWGAILSAQRRPGRARAASIRPMYCMLAAHCKTVIGTTPNVVRVTLDKSGKSTVHPYADRPIATDRFQWQVTPGDTVRAESVRRELEALLEKHSFGRIELRIVRARDRELEVSPPEEIARCL